MSEETHVENQRRELLNSWKELGSEFNELQKIVREPVTTLTHDDIRDWLSEIDNVVNQLYSLKNQTLEFMKQPENMEVLEQNTK